MFKDEDHGYGGNVELEHYWAPCSGSLGKIYEVWIEFLPPPSLARNKRNIWGWCKKYSWSFFMWYFRNVKFWRVLVHWFHLKPRKHRIKKKQMLKINSVQVLNQKSLRKREYLRGLDRVFTDAVISEKQKEHLRLKKYSWSIFIWKYPILKSFSTSLFSYSKTQNRFTGSTFYCFSALSSPEQETKG